MKSEKGVDINGITQLWGRGVSEDFCGTVYIEVKSPF